LNSNSSAGTGLKIPSTHIRRGKSSAAALKVGSRRANDSKFGHNNADYGFGAVAVEVNPVDQELYLPYWERQAFKSYKQIKVIKPELHSSVNEYTERQIQSSEKNLVTQALHFKQKLKNIDAYPTNAIGAGRPTSALPPNARRSATYSVKDEGSRHSTIVDRAKFDSLDNTIEATFENIQ
jgi:hypothetical protein